MEAGGAFEVEDAAGLAGVGEGDGGVGDGGVLGDEIVGVAGEAGDGDGGVCGGVAAARDEGGDERGEVGGEFHVGAFAFIAGGAGGGIYFGGGVHAAEFVCVRFDGFRLVDPSLVGFDEIERLRGGIADGFDEGNAGLGGVGVGNLVGIHVAVGGVDAIDEDLEIRSVERRIGGREKRGENEQGIFEKLRTTLAVTEGFFRNGHDGWWVGCDGLVFDESNGCVGSSQGCVLKSNGCVGSSQGCVLKSNGIVDSSQGIAEKSNGIVDSSQGCVGKLNGIVDSSQDCVGKLNGCVGSSQGCVGRLNGFVGSSRGFVESARGLVKSF